MRSLRLVALAIRIVALGFLASSAAPVAAAPLCNGQPATTPGSLTGTSASEVIIGTNGDDSIDGGGGDDTICGLGGYDAIFGGPGFDLIFGGDGSDTILGGTDTDVIHGGAGNDVLCESSLTGGGNDTYYGEDGNDFISCESGDNTAYGGNGDDIISVPGKAYGEAGNDPVVLARDPDMTAPFTAVADGGAGNDGHAFLSSFGVGVIGGTADGGSGNDVVAGQGVDDTLLGGSGSDFLDGTASGNQFLDCGSSYDTYATDNQDTIRRCEALGPNPNTN